MTYETAKAGNWVAESFAVDGDDIKLLGSAVGYVRFKDALSEGDTVFYSAFDDNNNREAGYATYSNEKLTDRVITATLKAGVYAEGEGLSPVVFSGDNPTIAGTFNQVAFEDLWQHLFNKENPHEVIAEQVPQNPANGRGDNVQEALDSLSEHANKNEQDLIDHENDVGNPHDVKADQVDLSPAFLPAGENVQTALEKIYQQFHLAAGNDDQLYLNFADGDETFIQMRRRYREDGGVQPAGSSSPSYDGFWKDPSNFGGDLSGLVGELQFFSREGRVYTFLEDGTMVLIASQYFFEDAPEDGRTWARKDGEWVEVTATVISDYPPTPITGTLWYDTGTTAELYVYDGDNWISMTGAGGGGAADADNVVLDDADPIMRNVALAREINDEGDGFWRQIYTSDLVTENNQPIFRDAQGRFTKADQAVIRNQKDANWYLLDRIEEGEEVDSQLWDAVQELQSHHKEPIPEPTREPIYAEQAPTEYPAQPPEPLQADDQWYEVTDPDFDYDKPDPEGLDLYIWTQVGDDFEWVLFVEEVFEYVSKTGGDEMEGPLKIKNNPEIDDSRNARKLEVLDIKSGSENSSA